MNKFGFISCILTFFLIFFSYIPLGIYVDFSSFTIIQLRSHMQLPVPLVNFRNNRVFMWGIITADGEIKYWVYFNILTFLFLTILPIFAGILAAIGFIMENDKGKKLIMYNNNALIIVIIYVFLGLAIYSKDIFNKQFIFDTFLYLDIGFAILVGDEILALIAYYYHPIK